MARSVGPVINTVTRSVQVNSPSSFHIRSCRSCRCAGLAAIRFTSLVLFAARRDCRTYSSGGLVNMVVMWLSYGSYSGLLCEGMHWNQVYASVWSCGWIVN